jgi:glycosyltransferase involved in cell wall biosynthesis
LQALLPHASLGVHRFAMPRVLGRGDLITPIGVSRLARKLDIDILHGHGAKGGFYARLARLGGSKAIAVYTPHGGVLHFSRSSPSGRVFHSLERLLMHRTTAIIFESRYAAQTYAQLIGVPTCPTRVIYNGLAAGEFVPVAPLENAADFVFVGELRDLKGIHVLIDALAGVRGADGSQASLVMAGDGGAREALVRQIERLGLTLAVTLLGAQPARPSFARGRIAVVPSLAESLPYIVLEAAAAQLPVIATGVGGIPEIFGPTAEHLVPAGDVAALRVAMQRTLDDPSAATAQMKQRIGFISDHFSLEHMVANIAEVYKSGLHKA